MLGAASESVCSIRLDLFVLPISLNDLARHRPCPVHPRACDDEEDPCWWNGSIMISEIGCGAFCRLIVSGRASGQIWIEDFGCDDILSPDPISTTGT